MKRRRRSETAFKSAATKKRMKAEKEAEERRAMEKAAEEKRREAELTEKLKERHMFERANATALAFVNEIA